MNDTLSIMVSDTAGYMPSADSSLIVSDTVRHAADTVSAGISSFMPGSVREIMPVAFYNQEDQSFLFVLIALALIVSIIWYYIPERLTNIFSLSAKTILKKSGEKGMGGPGIAVTVFFLINSLITASYFLLYVVKHLLHKSVFTDLNDWLAMAYIAAGLIVFSIVKIFLVRVSGFMFGTGDMAQKQQYIYFNSYNAIGVILIPLLFILLIIESPGWLYFILTIMAGMFIYRWVQIVVIGIRQLRFNSFHLILYLCTLEIIPLLILLKIFM